MQNFVLLAQVYDLQDHRPGKVLRRIYENLDAAVAVRVFLPDFSLLLLSTIS